ncbi:MAG: NusG domain II-containing protein [Clostridia bacterium]|nr:NusG domain II-containing protein [Clostridia bacterium]
MRKKDLIVIAVVAVLALGALFYNSCFLTEKGVYAEIYHDSNLVHRVQLEADKAGRFSVPEVPNVVFQLYDDGSIAFIESDCPDKICINSGKQMNVGQSAACLPNRLLLKIVSEDGAHGDVDLIIQ